MAVEGSASSRGKPDTSVILPSAVKRAAERSEELARQIKEGDTNPPSNGQNGVVIANFDPNNPTPPDVGQLPVVGQQPKQIKMPSNAQEHAQNVDNFEHQFRSLQGRYSRAEQENKRMAGQIADMQRLIAQVNVPPQQGNNDLRFNGPATGHALTPRRITEKEVSDYGSDLIDVIGRRGMEVIDAAVAPELTQLRSELNFLKQQVGGVRQTVAFDGRTRLYDTLEKELPNWEEINSHPDFVRWLGMSEPLSGQIRHAMLTEAFNNQQANRVLEFFRQFLADQAASGLQTSNPQPGIGSTINSGRTAPQVDLMALAAPGRAKTGQTAVSPEKPIINRSEISQFYRDKSLGKYAGRDDEVSRIEQEIFAASREGRIR